MIPDIISISLSFLALCVSIIFSIFSSMPHIKFKVDDCIHSHSSNLVCAVVNFSNKSPVAGDIENATLLFNGKKFDCVKQHELVNLQGVELKFVNGNAVCMDNIPKTLPITVKPFTTDLCILCFFVKGNTIPIKKAVLKIYPVSGLPRRFTVKPVPLYSNKEKYQSRSENNNA